jgi:hypothetical protein
VADCGAVAEMGAGFTPGQEVLRRAGNERPPAIPVGAVVLVKGSAVKGGIPSAYQVPAADVACCCCPATSAAGQADPRSP